MCLLVWSKIGSFVLTNKNFGVYIRMLSHMFVYLLVFLIIWGSWILCCSQIFTLLFYQENDAFATVEQSIISLINASFNNFELTGFKKSKVIGRYIYIANITISSIFLMNMIVAVLTGVYKQITDRTEADYNANLVIAEAEMRWDMKYGLLIFLPPPLNIISFLLCPVLFISNWISAETGEKWNQRLSKIAYFPIALTFYFIFLICSIILAPFVYLKGIILFPRLADKFKSRFLLSLFWLIFGLLIAIAYIIFDSIKYFKVLYHKNKTFVRKEKEDKH